MNSTIEQIKSIISPVRVLKVADFDLIALQLSNPYSKVNNHHKVVNLLSRYESLTSQPLVKEYFVCEARKPDKQDYQTRADFIDYGGFYKDLAEYQAAQKKLLFEGFEKEGELLFVKDRLRLLIPAHEPQNIQFMVHPYVFVLESPTIFDLITEISRYNRTASKPIQINFSDNFINELIK